MRVRPLLPGLLLCSCNARPPVPCRAALRAGLDREGVIGRCLRDVFNGWQGTALPGPELEKAAASCLDFQVRMRACELARATA